MTTTHLELERKYDPDLAVALPDLSQLRDVVQVTEAERLELEAVYFDTSDFALARRRITLRRRTGGGDAGWHLKLPTDGRGRQEVRLPLAQARVKPPKELRFATLPFTRGERLAPVATLRTTRNVRRLLGSDGTCLAEVCEDEVNAFDQASTERLVAWREWEVEVVDAGEGLLDEVDALMRSAGAPVAEFSSKLARVLGDRVVPCAPSPRPRPQGPVAAVLQARLAEQVDVLKWRDVDVRLSAHEGVHQLRVAMRRLRSALATFRPLVDRRVTDPLREELRWIAALLGEARDAEVMAKRLDRAVSTQPVELVLGAVTSRIDQTLESRRREGRTRSLEAMGTPRYLELLAALDRLVEDPPWTPLAQKSAKEVLPSLLRRDWKRLLHEVARVERAGDEHALNVALHEARKAAKRLRYAGEAARPVLGKDAKRLVRAAKGAQTLLGEHQDSVVTRPVLHGLGIEANRGGDSAFTFGLLYGLEQQRAAKLAEEFIRTWTTTWEPELRRLAN